MKFLPRFLMKLSAKISCEVSFSRRMSPKMTDFHLIPSSADDGTLRGFPFWEVFDTLRRFRVSGSAVFYRKNIYKNN